MSSVKKVPVSVLILTLNEALNIKRCIESVSFSDDIVVLDSYSSDNTVQEAERANARTFQRRFDDFSAQRNYALEHIEFKHDWVLHLDADEVITVKLQDEIKKTISNPRFSAYRIPSKLMMMDRWLRFSGMYPVYQVRLGHKDILRFQQVGHGQRETLEPDQVGTLKNSYLHYGFSKGVADWIERHNRYSSDEARQISGYTEIGAKELTRVFVRDKTERRRAIKRFAMSLPFRPLLRFLYMYFLKLGFLDGHAGWTYCRLMSMYEYWIILKKREFSSNRRNSSEG